MPTPTLAMRIGRPRARPPRTGPREGVPALTAAALPLAAGDHRRAGWWRWWLAAAIVLGRDPVGMVKGGWYSLRREYVWVKAVTATVVPPEATAAKSDPAALVDELKTSGP